MKKVSVIGLGYIGLPAAVLFASKDCQVCGVDTDSKLVNSIKSGQTPIAEPGLDGWLQSALTSGRLEVTNKLSAADAYVITVPTPLSGERRANLDYVQEVIEELAPLLNGGELVVIESTCPPGTTETVAETLLTIRPDLTTTPDQRNSIYLAYCPERVIPGRTMTEMIENDRILGGFNAEAADKAEALYSTFCRGTLVKTTASVAEIVKLAENSFRDVNIAFANELDLVCRRLGVDVWSVIKLANRHPRVDILQPGPGVGGHCIAVDPWFLHQAAPEASQLIRTARQVNDSKPHHVVDEIINISKRFQDPIIATLGLTFKPDIDDIRESPSLDIIKKLSDEIPSATFRVCEPNLTELPSPLNNRRNVEWTDLNRAVSGADIVLLLVDHLEFREIDRSLLKGKEVVDTRGIWK